MSEADADAIGLMFGLLIFFGFVVFSFLAGGLVGYFIAHAKYNKSKERS